MKENKSGPILYLLLAITTFMSIFFILRSNSLSHKLELSQSEGVPSIENNPTTLMSRISSIDSLLLNEEYNSAHLAYEELLAEIGTEQEVSEAIELRMKNIRKFKVMKDRLTSLERENQHQDVVDKNHKIDSLSERLAISQEMQREQLDSLSFALDKANMRSRNLSGQLANKISMDFLEFTNKEGVEVHYVGEVEDKKANGRGVGLYNTGSRYEGEWKDNLRHGKGIFFWPDGEHYEGSYQLDERHGEGKYFWPNGDMFTGEWKNDKRNGPGTFYGKDGKIVAKGIWKSNKLVEREENQ